MSENGTWEELEQIIKKLFDEIKKNNPKVSRVTLTEKTHDGGKDLVVEMTSNIIIYMECKFRNRELNYRDISPNALIAFCDGATSFVGITNSTISKGQTIDVHETFQNKVNMLIKFLSGDKLWKILDTTLDESTLNEYIEIKKSLETAPKQEMHSDLLVSAKTGSELLEEISELLRNSSKCEYAHKIFEKEIGEIEKSKILKISGLEENGLSEFIDEYVVYNYPSERIIRLHFIENQNKESFVLMLLGAVWGVQNTSDTLSRMLLSEDDDTDFLNRLSTSIASEKEVEEVKNLLKSLSGQEKKAMNIESIYPYILLKIIQNAGKRKTVFVLERFENISEGLRPTFLHFMQLAIESGAIFIVEKIERFTNNVGEDRERRKKIESIYKDPIFTNEYKLDEFLTCAQIDKFCNIIKQKKELFEERDKDDLLKKYPKQFKVWKYLSMDESNRVNEFAFKPNGKQDLYKYEMIYNQIFENNKENDKWQQLMLFLYISGGVLNEEYQKLVLGNDFSLKDFLSDYEQDVMFAEENLERVSLRAKEWASNKIEEYVTKMNFSSQCLEKYAQQIIEKLETAHMTQYTTLYFKACFIAQQYEKAIQLLEKQIISNKKYNDLEDNEILLEKKLEIYSKMGEKKRKENDLRGTIIELLLLLEESRRADTEKFQKYLKNFNDNYFPHMNRSDLFNKDVLIYNTFKIAQEYFDEKHFQHTLDMDVYNLAEKYNEKIAEAKDIDKELQQYVGKIIRYYALFMKKKKSNKDVLKIFEKGCEMIPTSFHLKYAYFSHVSNMNFFESPSKSLESHQEMFKLIEESGENWIITPYHEYVDMFMIALLCRDDKLARDAQYNVEKYVVLYKKNDELARYNHLLGWQEIIKGNLVKALEKFESSKLYLHEEDNENLPWKAELMIMYLQLKSCGVKNKEETSKNVERLIEKIKQEYGEKICGELRATQDLMEFKKTESFNILLILIYMIHTLKMEPKAINPLFYRKIKIKQEMLDLGKAIREFMLDSPYYSQENDILFI